MGDGPLVSVVMPTYNRASFLDEAIGSVRDQSWKNWELLLVDDRSTDGTAELVSAMAAREPRIRYLKNDRTPGSGGARNRGIAEAQGDFVAFLDSDDRWYPQHLERVLARFAAHPDVSLVGCDHCRINRASGERKTASEYMFELIEIWEKDPIARGIMRGDEIRRDIQEICRREQFVTFVIAEILWLQTSTVVIRREVFDEVGAFNEQLPRTEDYDLWLRISARFRIGFEPEVLGEFEMTGQDAFKGERYENYEAKRLSSTVDRWLCRVRILRGLSSRRLRRRHGYVDELSREQKRFLWDRLRNLHRKIAFSYHRTDKLRAAMHHLRAARYRPKDVIYFLHRPRRFLSCRH